MNIRHSRSPNIVHTGTHYTVNGSRQLRWPVCIDGPEMTRKRSAYGETEAEVNCEKCLASEAIPGAPIDPVELDERIANDYDISHVETHENGTTLFLKKKETADDSEIQQYDRVPHNWLYMAKHADTESARLWWARKCAAIVMELETIDEPE